MSLLPRTVESPALVIPKQKGEEVRWALIDAGLLRRGLRIREVEGKLLLPVNQEVSMGYPVETHDFEEVATRARSYRDVLRVPDEVRSLLPRAYDVVGDVVIIRLPDELAKHDRDIGAALLEAVRGARTVAVDRGVTGAERQRNLRVIAGRETTRTVHREYGIVISVDPSRVHFSPRMASERRRVSRQVVPGEVVVDAFCGVGPFALHMARRGARVVYAIDSNADAIELLRENLRMNELDNVVEVEGDVLKLLPTLEPADRIVLDYPWDPLPAFPVAISTLKDGGVLHYYEILEMAEVERRVETLEGLLPPDYGLEVLEERLVRGYSPTRAHYVFDLRVSGG